MKIAKLVTVIFLLLQLGALNGFTQGAGIEWDTLNQEVLRLYRAGQYERAIIVAQEVLKVAERSRLIKPKLRQSRPLQPPRCKKRPPQCGFEPEQSRSTL